MKRFLIMVTCPLCPKRPDPHNKGDWILDAKPHCSRCGGQGWMTKMVSKKKMRKELGVKG